MKPRKPVVWVVIHCEYLPREDLPYIDEMVFHVASSLKAAEHYLRPLHVDAYSWWKVERRSIDLPEDNPARHYYTYRGAPRKSPPHAAARRAYDKWQEEARSLAGEKSPPRRGKKPKSD